MLPALSRAVAGLICLTSLIAACGTSANGPVTSLPVPDDPAPTLDVRATCYEPTWRVPDGAYEVQLETPETAGTTVSGRIVVPGSSMPGLRHMASVPLILIARIADPQAAVFDNGQDHVYTTVTISKYSEQAEFVFPINVRFLRAGTIKILLGWRWRIATEGCCGLAIDAVYLGCSSAGQLNKACVCRAMAGLKWPSTWCCKAHPLTFRAAWRSWGCTGASPY